MFKVVKLSSAKAGGWPLYCMPTASGAVDGYLDLAQIVGHDRPVYGLAWRANNWDKFKSLQEFAAPAAKLMAAHRLNGPLYIFGYSFGGIFAIETAHQLAKHGVPVPLVAVGDQAPYGYSFSLGYRIRHFARAIGPWAIRVATRYLTDATHRLNYRNAMRRKLKGQHVFDGESWYQGLPENRKHYTSQNLANSQKYRFEGVYRGKILLLRALEGKRLDPFQPRHLEDYGWGRITGAAVDVLEVPGDHSSIVKQPDVVYLGAAVREALKDCDRNLC